MNALAAVSDEPGSAASGCSPHGSPPPDEVVLLVSQRLASKACGFLAAITSDHSAVALDESPRAANSRPARIQISPRVRARSPSGLLSTRFLSLLARFW